MKNYKMKKIFSAILFSGLMFASCEFQHPVPNVLPDPVFDARGLQEYDAISIYEEVPVELSFTRVFGVSKEIKIDLAIDETLIADHNNLYGSNYTLMPAEYYVCPEAVSFEPNTKTAKGVIKVLVDELVKDKGLEAANNMLIPVKMGDTSEALDAESTNGNVLVKLNIDTPKVEVEVPAAKSLSFISAFPLTQTVTVSAATNFVTLDVDEVTVSVDESKVATYNAANETNHVLLPANFYTIKNVVFDDENCVVSADIDFNCATVEVDKTYILPLVMSTDAYELTQEAPIYVLVQLDELKISVVQGGQTLAVNNKAGVLNAAINCPLPEDFAINFKYDVEKAAEYNAANGNAFTVPAADKVNVTASSIVAGAQEGAVNFSINWADTPYDNGEKFLIALTLDGILEGTILEGPQTVYVEMVKTLSGVWTVDDMEPLYPAKIDGTYKKLVGNTIWLADGLSTVGGVAKPKSDNNQKYVIIYGGGWSDGLLYFDIDFSTEIEGKPGCHPLINLQDRPSPTDHVENYNCYFDSVNEEFNWDFTVVGYWSPGGGGGGNPEAGHVPGYTKCGRMHSKQ